MVLPVAYAATAMVLAPWIFVVARSTFRQSTVATRHDNPIRLAFYSILAALLWPVLALGLAQFAVILAVRQVIVVNPSDPHGPGAGQPRREAVSCVGSQAGTPAT